MQRAWRGHKYKLHNHFKEVGGEQDLTKAKNNCPDEVSQDDWNFLCDSWSDPIYKVIIQTFFFLSICILLIEFEFFRIEHKRMQIIVQKENGTLEMAQSPLHVIMLVVGLIWMLQQVILRLGVSDIGTQSVDGHLLI